MSHACNPSSLTAEGLPGEQAYPHGAFWAYVCRKAPLQLAQHKQPGSLPEGWCTATKQVGWAHAQAPAGSTELPSMPAK